MQYRFNTDPICRSKNQSVAGRVAYITGKRFYDRDGKPIFKPRSDVIWADVIVPSTAPDHFHELQSLCDAMENAEARSDARTARQYMASLPNELPTQALIDLVKEYIEKNFTSLRLCTIAAIHDGLNPVDARENNPHVHMIVSTRTATPKGFSKKKTRVLDSRTHLVRLREHWAEAQNQEYKHYELPCRVSSKTRDEIDREHEHELYR